MPADSPVSPSDIAALWAGTGLPDDALRSEDDCLALIDRFFPARDGHAALGRGDDCAELRMPGIVALSNDIFLEGAHFRRAYFTPREVGAKALATAISDLAGAGAVPLGLSLGLLLPAGTPKSVLAEVLAGMAEVAGRQAIFLSGGDIARAETLGFCLTVWGKSALEGRDVFLRRGQAQPGDGIFLIGASGLAGVGLRSLEALGRTAVELYPAACAAHLSPQPLTTAGATLARQFTAPEHRLGLMDLSDGPVRDLPRLLAGLGADLDPAQEAIHPEIQAYAAADNLPAESLFLLGGEDYALIGTCAPQSFAGLRALLPQTVRLGTVRAEPGLTLRGRPLHLVGFDHLAGSAKAVGPGDGINEAARTLVRLCRRSHRAGLFPGFSGNASLRLTLADGREACLITRSGAAKGRLGTDDFALLDLADGTLIRGGKPSSEAALHLRLYRANPKSRAVLHTHPPRLTALGLILPPERRLRLPLFEAAGYREKLAWVPDIPPGTEDLAKAAAEAAGRPALWLERHGLCVHGLDPWTCLALAEELEHLAGVQLLAGKN